jgi:hypothetical protein
LSFMFIQWVYSSWNRWPLVLADVSNLFNYLRLVVKDVMYKIQKMNFYDLYTSERQTRVIILST